MLTSDALSVFGSPVAVAEILGITPQAVYQWREYVPPLSAARLAKASQGKLTFDPDLYESWGRKQAS